MTSIRRNERGSDAGAKWAAASHRRNALASCAPRSAATPAHDVVHSRATAPLPLCTTPSGTRSAAGSLHLQ